jgi:uncharacterized protein (TIGR01777 family)
LRRGTCGGVSTSTEPRRIERVAITGATGLIGGALTRLLRGDGVRVLTVGRGASSDVRWAPDSATLDASRLEGLDAVVHLAGSPIDVRWTRNRRREIRDSRVNSTALLADTLAALSAKPAVLVCGSAVGFYGDRRDELLNENSSSGDGFLASVVREWERATHPALDAGIRVANVRTGVVISRAGGMLKRILLPFRVGLGGPIGGGAQWLSWIALDDHIRAIRFLLHNRISGPVNLVSPNPVTNRVFTAALGRVLRRPAVIPLPAFALRGVFGQMADETILASQRAVPSVLTASSFSFEAPDIEQALRRELYPPG